MTIDPALRQEVESALSCQWMADAVGALTCLQAGTWLVRLRPVCQSGERVPGLTGPTLVTLCAEHCACLLSGFDRRVGKHLACGGCLQRYDSPFHLADHWAQVAGTEVDQSGEGD